MSKFMSKAKVTLEGMLWLWTDLSENKNSNLKS